MVLQFAVDEVGMRPAHALGQNVACEIKKTLQCTPQVRFGGGWIARVAIRTLPGVTDAPYQFPPLLPVERSQIAGTA